ncbi:MAG: polymerase delta subunit [Actinomycetia bacterium]|nr:polymerase delta subunit [Actinomycetes bacterium]
MSDALITLVRGDDPALRDREVQRIVEALLGGDDRSFALDDHTVASNRRRSGGDDVDVADAESLDLPVFSAITTALQSPPFMTACRVVVVREIGNLSKDQVQWFAEYAAAPLDTSRLVLVSGSGKVPAALEKALKAAKVTVVGPASEKTDEVLGTEARDAGVHLTADAKRSITQRFGEDASRVPELVELLHSTFGEERTLDVADIDAYLGELGTAGKFDLANAIDKGDLPAALEVLHRQLTATSARDPKPVHPLVIMAMLVSHYQRFLRLDDPLIVTKEQAAEVLGMRSPAGAGFALRAARDLGTDGLREAMGLLAQAELDLRGASGVDERTVMEVLVARLAHLSRRHQRGSSRKPAGSRR